MRNHIFIVSLCASLSLGAVPVLAAGASVVTKLLENSKRLFLKSLKIPKSKKTPEIVEFSNSMIWKNPYLRALLLKRDVADIPSAAELNNAYAFVFNDAFWNIAGKFCDGSGCLKNHEVYEMRALLSDSSLATQNGLRSSMQDKLKGNYALFRLEDDGKPTSPLSSNSRQYRGVKPALQKAVAKAAETATGEDNFVEVLKQTLNDEILSDRVLDFVGVGYEEKDGQTTLDLQVVGYSTVTMRMNFTLFSERVVQLAYTSDGTAVYNENRPISQSQLNAHAAQLQTSGLVVLGDVSQAAFAQAMIEKM